jgi:transposase
VAVASVLTRLESLDQQLSAQIAEIESELVDILHQSSPETPEAVDWSKTITCLQTIPGIGLLTALWIVVSTLNFTLCQSAEQAAAYAGLAPIPRQSGTSVNKRPCIGHTGNARLRTALYLATLSGTQYNPTLKTFYERLLAKGKPKKVARCAAARKLLHLAWAVGTKQEAYMASCPPTAA